MEQSSSRSRNVSVLAIVVWVVCGLLGHMAFLAMQMRIQSVIPISRFVAWLSFVPWCGLIALLLFRRPVARAAAVPLLLLGAIVASGGGSELASNYRMEARAEAQSKLFPEGRRLPSPPELLGIDGTSIDLAHFDGQYLLLNFWRTWCKPCIEEIPVLDQLNEDVRFQVLGVNNEASELQANFAEVHKLRFPLAVHSEDASWSDVTQFPTSVLLDSDGTVRGVWRGPVTLDGVLEVADRQPPRG